MREPVAGDTVRLRSGGPCMTVEDVTNKNAKCRWFVEHSPGVWGELRDATFDIALLSVRSLAKDFRVDP